MKNKVIVFKSQAEHFWYSCRIIEEHILNAFKQSQLDFEIYEIDKSLSQPQIDSLKSETSKLHFYFLSDFIKQQDLCQQLLATSIDGTFYIPIYGNMTVEIYRWLSLGEILKGQNVFLLGASHRSCRQIKAFIDAEVIEIPFCFETDLRKTDIKSEKKNIVYAGRITPQKNTLELLQTFHEAYQFNSNLHLHIAGQFHDRTYHLHGYILDIEKYNSDVKVLMSHPGITFHQNLSQNELLKLYQASDYFVSMSTYHDEDFGMSACQAAVMGLGLILSDWGGQASYKENSSFIPVSVNDINLPEIKTTPLLKSLVKPIEISGLTNYKTLFSYASFIQNLMHLMNREPAPMKGLTELYKDYSKIGLKVFPFSNLEKNPSKKDFYLSIYQSYLSDN